MQRLARGDDRSFDAGHRRAQYSTPPPGGWDIVATPLRWGASIAGNATLACWIDIGEGEIAGAGGDA